MQKDNSREELIKIIKKHLFDSSNEQFKLKVQEFMTQKGRFELSEYKQITMGLIDLNSLKDYELFWFAYAMETIGQTINPKIYICRVSDFFTPVEVKNTNFFRRENIKLDELYVLHNAVQISSNQFSCTVSVQQIAEMKRRGIIRVTPELQRQSRTVKNAQGTEILQQIEINKKKVKEIEEKIVNDKYHYNMIRLNLINDGIVSFEYDNENRCIFLPENGDVIIPDGNHRILGAEIAYSKYPELKDMFAERYFTVAFTFYDVDTVKDAISQEWKVTPPNARHKAAMERNYANRIVEWIKIDPKAEDIYKNNITTTGDERGLIVQSILANAIERFYEVNSFDLNSQAQKVKDWLVEFFNYISELMIDDFKDYKNTRKYKWSTESLTWIGYTFLSRQLENNNQWKIVLSNFIHTINWDKSTSPIIRKSGDELRVEKYFIKKWRDYCNGNV